MKVVAVAGMATRRPATAVLMIASLVRIVISSTVLLVRHDATDGCKPTATEIFRDCADDGVNVIASRKVRADWNAELTNHGPAVAGEAICSAGLGIARVNGAGHLQP